MDSGDGFACFFINHAARGFIGLPGASESDVYFCDLTPFFDVDDPGLFLVGCVRMIGAWELSAAAAKRIAPSFAACADDVAPRRQPVEAINTSVVRFRHLVHKVTLVVALLLLPIHCVKLYTLRNERRALVVNNFAGHNAATDQSEIYLLARLAFIEGYRPAQFRIAGTTGGDEGVQHCAYDVAPLGQAADQITALAVSPRFGLERNAQVRFAGAGLQIGLRDGDHRVRRRFSGNGHAPADRSSTWAGFALRRLRACPRAGLTGREEKQYWQGRKESEQTRFHLAPPLRSQRKAVLFAPLRLPNSFGALLRSGLRDGDSNRRHAEKDQRQRFHRPHRRSS